MPSMLAGLNPGWVLIIAGVASLFITMRSVRQVVTIAAPLLALLLLVLAPQNTDLVTTSQGHLLSVLLALLLRGAGTADGGDGRRRQRVVWGGIQHCCN